MTVLPASATNPAASRADIKPSSAPSATAFRLAGPRSSPHSSGPALHHHATPAIIALGGGTPIAPPRRSHPASPSRRVCPGCVPPADVATLRHRISQEPSAHRPSLTGRPIEDEIAHSLRTRVPAWPITPSRSLDRACRVGRGSRAPNPSPKPPARPGQRSQSAHRASARPLRTCRSPSSNSTRVPRGLSNRPAERLHQSGVLLARRRFHPRRHIHPERPQQPDRLPRCRGQSPA